MQRLRGILARGLHLGGIRRNAFTQSRRLITRRSQVQILPPLLERPGNGVFSVFEAKHGARGFAQLLPARSGWCAPAPDDPLHGKEGVDGSSPSEGLPKVPANRRLWCCLLVEHANTFRTHLRYARRTATSHDAS